MYNYKWPETPVPSVNQRNFPNPAAFLETPTIIRGRPRPELNRSMRIENAPPSDYFNTAYSALNDSMLFDANIIKRKPAQTTREAPVSKYAKPLPTSVAPTNQKNVSQHQAADAGTANGNGSGKQDPKAALRIVSGTIQHILKLIREQQKLPTMLLFETVANVLSMKTGQKPGERVILLRNHEAGPILQAIYYEIDRQLTPLNRGDLVRCVGRLQPFGNRFQILKITRTSDQYERAIVRLQTVSAFVSKVMR
ncbi:hypothetical protein AND_010371 [Anopheles darlingi]|uniref:Uncharacterized protein n=1 Tax=Anopheles darlingi TaxID=43151 RepID=W5J2R3_ANODA|nr:hypothetical protein AND_010371 [Anopheles darlingi]